MLQKHGVMAVVSGLLVWTAGGATAVALDPYTGAGKIHVLSDGRLLIEHHEPAQDGTAFLIEDGTSHFLISDGTKARIISPLEVVPSGTKTKVPFTGDGSQSVGEFAGTVRLTSPAEDEWLMQVEDDGTVIFEYRFASLGQGAQAGGCYVPSSCGGGCSCTACVICWCFCGLFNDPHCICIFPYPELAQTLVA